MKKIIIVTIFSVLIDPYVRVNLSVTAVVLMAWYGGGSWVLVPAVVMGVVRDLLTVKPLGLTSMGLVLLGGGLDIIKRQFGWSSWPILVLAAILGEVEINLIIGEPVSLRVVVIQALVVSLLWLVAERINNRDGVYLK